MDYEGEDRRSHSILDIRVANLEKAVERVIDAVESIDKSLQSLSRLETRHEETRDAMARAFKSLEFHDNRLRIIEIDMPTIKMVKGWVVAGVLGIIALFGVAIINMALNSVHAIK